MEEHKHHEHHKEHEHPVHHEEHGHHAHHEEHEHHKPNMKLWIMAIILGLLIVLSGVQAIELVSLKNKLNNEITTLAKTSKSTVSTGGGLSDNIKNLPSMVGGC